jgi:hypothetical protein
VLGELLAGAERKQRYAHAGLVVQRAAHDAGFGELRRLGEMDDAGRGGIEERGSVHGY